MLDADYVRQTLIDIGDLRSEHWPVMRRATLPPERLLATRMEGLTLGVLGQLEARANWHRITREWLYGDAPANELGRQEADFFTRRPAGGPSPGTPAAPRGRPRPAEPIA